MTVADMTFRVDYCGYTVHGAKTHAVLSELVRFGGDAWSPDEWELLQQDERSIRRSGPFGAYVQEDLRQAWTHVELKGEACNRLGTERLLAVARSGISRWG